MAGTPNGERRDSAVAGDPEEDAARGRAERILSVAKEAATQLHAEARAEEQRLREELTRWSDEHRRAVEADMSALLDEARKDAALIRTEVLGQAMAEAEETARRYVAMAVAVGEQDAQALRAEARALLARAARALEQARDRTHGLGESVSSHGVSLDEEIDVLARLARAAQDGSMEGEGKSAGPDATDWRPQAPALPLVEDEGEPGPLPRQRSSPEGRSLGSILGRPRAEGS